MTKCMTTLPEISALVAPFGTAGSREQRAVQQNGGGGCFGCCHRQTSPSSETAENEGGKPFTRWAVKKAPHHLCASGTWISLEQSFKDWTQFSCLPPAINRVAESFVLLDCVPSLLQTTVFTGSEWNVLKLHAYAGGQELGAVSRSATQLASIHNKQKCFQRYGVREITVLFSRGRECSRSSVFLVRSCHHAPLESWTSLSCVDITGVSEFSHQRKQSNWCSCSSLHLCINYLGEEGLMKDQSWIRFESANTCEREPVGTLPLCAPVRFVKYSSFFQLMLRLLTVEWVLQKKWGCALVTYRIFASYRIQNKPVKLVTDFLFSH